jgi:hypothetical protein
MRRRALTICCALLLATAALADPTPDPTTDGPPDGPPSGPPDQPPPGPAASALVGARPARILHLRLKGDLDSAKLLDELAGARARAHEQKAELLLLELSGNRWRSDLVLRAGKILNDDPRLPWVVWLHDPSPARAKRDGPTPRPDKRAVDPPGVGAGQAALGLLAEHLYISPSTRIVHDNGDQLDDAAPVEPNEPDGPAPIERLRSLLEAGLSRRGAAPILSSALPVPTRQIWAVIPASMDEAPTLSGVPPPPGMPGTIARIVERPSPLESPRLEVDALIAVRVGLADALARDTGQILVDRGLRARPLARAEITSGLPGARATLLREIRALADDTDRLEVEIRRAEALKPAEARSLRQAAGRELLPASVVLQKRLADAEHLTTTYPELLHVVPPGRTPVAQQPARLPAVWKSEFQSLRDRLEKLRDRARRLLET